MALERRGNRIYYYSKVRENGRVTSRYLACGNDAVELHVRTRSEREKYRAEAARLSSVLYDAAFRNYFDGVTRAVDCMMKQIGYERYKQGEWRPMNTSGNHVEPRSDPAILGELALTAMLSSIRAVDGSIPAQFEVRVRQDIAQRYRALLLDGDSPVEQVLAFRIAITEARVMLLETLACQTTSLKNRSLIENQITATDRRLAQSCRALASVRRIPNLTLVQVNASANQVAQE